MAGVKRTNRRCKLGPSGVCAMLSFLKENEPLNDDMVLELK